MVFLKRRPLQERLDEALGAASASGCREYTGARNAHGYGVLGVGRRRTILAHRLAFCLAAGRDIDSIAGLTVCHHCDNPPCCNPDHLFLGTQRDNVRDMLSKGRRGGPMGEAHPWSKLCAQDVVAIREMNARGMSQRAIARHYAVNKTSIKLLLDGTTWRHVE